MKKRIAPRFSPHQPQVETAPEDLRTFLTLKTMRQSSPDKRIGQISNKDPLPSEVVSKSLTEGSYCQFFKELPPIESLINILSQNQVIKQEQIHSSKSPIILGKNSLFAAYIDIDHTTIYLVLRRDAKSNQYFRQLWFQLKGQINNSSIKIYVLNHSRNIKEYAEARLNIKYQNQQQQFVEGLAYKAFFNEKLNCFRLQFVLNRNDIERGVEISMYKPYNINKIQSLLEDNNLILKIEEIGKTTKGNPLYCFTIDQQEAQINIIVLARQHPCENVSSLVCQQLIRSLNQRAEQNCLKKLRWHVIPMVNPDGVQTLNTRVNSLGYDINRCWAPHLFRFSPEAASIAGYFRRISAKSEDVVIDLHGHSREFDCFTFCTTKSEWNADFNRIMGEKCSFFNLNKCLFGIHETKRHCLRSYIQKVHRINRCITLETSLNGYIKDQTFKKFSQQDYVTIANSLLETIEAVVQVKQIKQMKQPLTIKPSSRYKVKQNSTMENLSDTNIKFFQTRTNIRRRHVTTLQGQASKSQIFSIQENSKSQVQQIRNAPVDRNTRTYKSNIINLGYMINRSCETGRQRKTPTRTQQETHYYSMKTLLLQSQSMRPRKTKQIQEVQIIAQQPCTISRQTLTIPSWNQYEDIWNQKLRLLNAQALKKKVKSRQANMAPEQGKRKKDIDGKLERLEVSVSQIMKLMS